MSDTHCPKCGSSDVALREVKDLLWAIDPCGQAFEVRFQSPVWTCRACKLNWQGKEALAAQEAAYQCARIQRSVQATTTKLTRTYGDVLREHVIKQNAAQRRFE